MIKIIKIMEVDEDDDECLCKDDDDVQKDVKLHGRQCDMEVVEIFCDSCISFDKSSLLMAGNATAAAMEINKKREAELFKLKQVLFALYCICIFPKLVASGVER